MPGITQRARSSIWRGILRRTEVGDSRQDRLSYVARVLRGGRADRCTVELTEHPRQPARPAAPPRQSDQDGLPNGAGDLRARRVIVIFQPQIWQLLPLP